MNHMRNQSVVVNIVMLMIHTGICMPDVYQSILRSHEDIFSTGRNGSADQMTEVHGSGILPDDQFSIGLHHVMMRCYGQMRGEQNVWYRDGSRGEIIRLLLMLVVKGGGVSSGMRCRVLRSFAGGSVDGINGRSDRYSCKRIIYGDQKEAGYS